MSINDLLTPEELEALLEEVDTGRLAADETISDADQDVTRYDFSAQEHIIRSSMPTLEMIYEKFSRQLRTTLSGVLRRGVGVELARVESLRYVDWLGQLPGQCGMHLVRVRPLQGTALFVLHSQLVYMLVDGYFGGRAADEEADEGVQQRKEITSAELRVTRILIDRMARDLEGAWAPVYQIGIEHAGVETNPLFASIASSPERVIAARFDIRLGKLQGELSFVVPYAMVEPIKALLDNGLVSEHGDVDRRWRECLLEGLQTVPLELRGTLVELAIPLRRILTLKPGDVIPIDIPGQLPIDVEGEPTFRGALGVARGRKAVKITQVSAEQTEAWAHAGSSSAPGDRGDASGRDSAERRQPSGFAACA